MAHHIIFRIFFGVLTERDLFLCGASLYGHRPVSCLAKMDCTAMAEYGQSRIAEFGPLLLLASGFDAAMRLHQTGHSCVVLHFR
jgi:hypothetical protein